MNFFASSHGCGTVKRNVSKSAFSEGVGHFEQNFRSNGGSPTKDVVVTWRCLRDRTFSRFDRKPARDRQTDRHTTSANIRAAPRG